MQLLRATSIGLAFLGLAAVVGLLTLVVAPR
jgi:hypothetical protein